MREGRVGVLQVRYHDEPVVTGVRQGCQKRTRSKERRSGEFGRKKKRESLHREVGDTVVLDDFSEASHLLSEEGEEGEHADEEGVRDENIRAVTSVENEGLGVEVCRVAAKDRHMESEGVRESESEKASGDVSQGNRRF